MGKKLLGAAGLCIPKPSGGEYSWTDVDVVFQENQRLREQNKRLTEVQDEWQTLVLDLTGEIETQKKHITTLSRVSMWLHRTCIDLRGFKEYSLMMPAVYVEERQGKALEIHPRGASMIELVVRDENPDSE